MVITVMPESGEEMKISSERIAVLPVVFPISETNVKIIFTKQKVS